MLRNVRTIRRQRLQQYMCRLFASSTSKTVPYNLTDIGEGITEVEIIEWFVAEGDEVKQFDKVCEVQSDKANVEIPSRFDGVIKEIMYGVGDMAFVGKPLMMIEVEGSDESGESTSTDVSDAEGHQSPEETETETVAARARAQNDERAIATPAVRRIARENNVDLQQVLGTGKDGRVLKGDVLAYVNQSSSNEVTTSSSREESAKQEDISIVEDAAAPPSDAAPRRRVLASKEDVVVPIRGIQRAMVHAMTQSLSIPHFGYCDEFEMTEAMEMRRRLQETSDVKVTLMPLMLKAASLALDTYPVLNSSVSEDLQTLTQHASHNIGVAMDTPRGLLVPVVRDVQAMSVIEIAEEMQRLQKLGTENKLGGDDLAGATFSLSNIGSIGGTYASPVIAPPQVAIGALGKIQKLPRFDEDDGETVVATRIMNVSWAADHRVIDGATMARFSNLMKKYLEVPVSMLGAMR